MTVRVNYISDREYSERMRRFLDPFVADMVPALGALRHKGYRDDELIWIIPESWHESVGRPYGGHSTVFGIALAVSPAVDKPILVRRI